MKALFKTVQVAVRGATLKQNKEICEVLLNYLNAGWAVPDVMAMRQTMQDKLTERLQDPHIAWN